MTLAWWRTKLSQRCCGSGVRTGLCLRRYLPTVRGEIPMVSFRFNSLAMRSSPQVGFSAATSGMSLRKSLGMRGLPTGRDFQRQRRRNPWRCQRTKVSGRTFTRASRHANRRPRITIISRVESSARCGFTFRSRNRASGLRRKRFSLASARRDLETSPRRRTRSHATEDNVLRLCVSGWKTAPRMNDQLYTLLDVTRLPIGGWAKFLRTTTAPEPEVAGNLEGDRPHFRPVDSCTAHPASLPECALRRSHPREEPYALAAPVRICAGLCQERAAARCCIEDEGRSFEVGL